LIAIFQFTDYKQIAGLKDCLEADFPVNQPSQNFHGPALLIGLCPPIDKDEILELIPPKNVTDRLVSRFFNSMEPGVGKHSPENMTAFLMGLEYQLFYMPLHFKQRFVPPRLGETHTNSTSTTASGISNMMPP
jgi:hypothetical protein